jgi:hypothetical protein
MSVCYSHCNCVRPRRQSDVLRKISHAYCPAGVVEGNPCVDYVKHIVFGKFSEFTVQNTTAEPHSQTCVVLILSFLCCFDLLCPDASLFLCRSTFLSPRPCSLKTLISLCLLVFDFPPACARVYAPHVSHLPSPRSTYASYEAFESAYTSGAIGADDLKASLGASINAMLEPVRQHFQNDARAKAILEEVRSFKVTR